MSRFNNLLKGLSDSSPQIKGTLQQWGEELKQLQANPAGNERRIQELSDNIRSTVEANAKRSAPAGDKILVNPKMAALSDANKQESIMKKVAGAAAMPSPELGLTNPVDQLKSGYGDFEVARKGLSDKLANAVTGYLPEASKAQAVDQAQRVMNVATDPLNYVGGVGAADVAINAAQVLPEDTIKRFKGLFGN